MFVFFFSPRLPLPLFRLGAGWPPRRRTAGRYAALQRERGQQPGQPEAVVGVHVRDEDDLDARQLDLRAAQNLLLRAWGGHGVRGGERESWVRMRRRGGEGEERED